MFDEPITFAGSSGLSGYSFSAPAPSSSSSNFFSGALQSALALGNGYLSRRLDIDLQSRLAGMQPTGTLQGGQTTAAVTAPATDGGMNLRSMLPIAVLVIGAFLILGRKG